MVTETANGSTAAALTLLLPLLVALGVRPMAVIWRGGARLIGPLALVLCASFGLFLLVDGNLAPGYLWLGAAGASLGLTLRLDGLALVLAVVAHALVLLGWTRGEDHPDQLRMDAAMLLLAGGLTGLALAGDLVTTWLFLELCTLAGAALLLFGGTLRALIAVATLLRWGALGSALIALGLGLASLSAGSLSDGPLSAGLLATVGEDRAEADASGLSRLGDGLVMLGFGVKVALFPLNAWLASAARAAPARVLALLTGALPALTLASLARLLASGDVTSAAATVMMVLGTLSVLAGGFGMWRARVFPTFLTALSLANLGAIGIGFSLPGPAGPFSALALLFHFLLIQSALFVIGHRWRWPLSDLAGIAREQPLVSAALVLFAASLVGVPPLPGFWARLMLVLSLAEHAGPAAMLVLLLYLLAAAVEAAGWLRLLRRLYAQGPEEVGAALEGATMEGGGTMTDHAAAGHERAAARGSAMGGTSERGGVPGADGALAADGAAAGGTGLRLPRADRLPRLRRPGRLALAYQLLVGGVLLLATLAVVPVAEGLNRLAAPLAAGWPAHSPLEPHLARDARARPAREAGP